MGLLTSKIWELTLDTHDCILTLCLFQGHRTHQNASFGNGIDGSPPDAIHDAEHSKDQ